VEKIESLRIDLRRTQERIKRAETLGDWTARSIGQAREKRLLAELEVALGIQRPTIVTARSAASAS